MKRDEMIERLTAYKNGWESPKAAMPDFWEGVIEAVRIGDDAISRQAAIDLFKKWQPYMATRIYEFEKELYALPPVEQKQGKWEWVQYDANPEIGNFHCSECRYIPAIFNLSAQRMHYCPNCGAKMCGGDNNG